MKRPKPKSNLNGAWYDVREINAYIGYLEDERLAWALEIIRGMEVAPPLKKLFEEAFKSSTSRTSNG